MRCAAATRIPWLNLRIARARVGRVDAWLGLRRVWRRSLPIERDRGGTADARELVAAFRDGHDAPNTSPLRHPAGVGFAAISCWRCSQQARAVEEAGALGISEARSLQLQGLARIELRGAARCI